MQKQTFQNLKSQPKHFLSQAFGQECTTYMSPLHSQTPSGLLKQSVSSEVAAQWDPEPKGTVAGMTVELQRLLLHLSAWPWASLSRLVTGTESVWVNKRTSCVFIH